MHAIYRSTFNAVDLFNREAFGPLSVQYAVNTKSWYRRFFLALLGMAETNAMFAYRKTVGEITRYGWLAGVSDKLLNNPWSPDAVDLRADRERDWEDHDNLHYREHHMACAMCRKRTSVGMWVREAPLQRWEVCKAGEGPVLLLAPAG